MAAGKESQQLTENQIVRLSAVISRKAMKGIALGYMGIDDLSLENIEVSNREDHEGFKREVIRNWGYRHPENQIQVRSFISPKMVMQVSLIKT